MVYDGSLINDSLSFRHFSFSETFVLQGLTHCPRDSEKLLSHVFYDIFPLIGLRNVDCRVIVE